ncbi:hypothetical protein TcG_08229, partial [Trypanosoma cruzi]
FGRGVSVDSTRLCFADLMRVFPSGSVCAPSPLGCGVRVDVKVPASRFIAFPAVAAAAAFLRSCGFLTRCFGEGVAALIVYGILILVSRSGEIERAGLLPFCFICPLCLTASSTLKCCSAPQLSLLIACANSSLLPFQCHILLIDGRHSVRRATLIGLRGTARQRHRRKQAEDFTYLNAVLRARIFHMFCWALKQRGVRNYACVELVLPCEPQATPRGCHFYSAELLCLFAGLTGKLHAPCYCCCVQMPLHARTVLH